MTRKKKEFGKCLLCTKEGMLTFEHIPPKSAFNKEKKKFYSGKELLKHITSDNLPWDVSKIKGKEQQGGAGRYSLCNECNNLTGLKYVSALRDFYEQGVKGIVQAGKEQGEIIITFKDIYPLRIIKEIICMMLCINPLKFGDNYPELRSFILNHKMSKRLNNFSLSVYLNMGLVERTVGNAVILSEGKLRHLSELGTRPFGLVLEDNEICDKRLLDISFFSQYQYDEKIDITLKLPLLSPNTALPLNFLTIKEINNIKKD